MMRRPRPLPGLAVGRRIAGPRLDPDIKAHFLDGFGNADGKFHFKADWWRTCRRCALSSVRCM